MQSQNEYDDILMALVEGALARPPAEREVYLQSACSADPALYKEVRSRIEWEERMDGFLGEPIVRLGEVPVGADAVFPKMGPQSWIAHYRITAKLGEGGMGEVWRATDTKLNREVAVKVIPASLAENHDRMVRFEREAKVLASLNHPNIAAIYGVEERALVMELVEGETLAGPLSVEQAMPLVHQLIDALEWAHEKGIVHRDLKLANIKVTPEERLKVLDFGLAKAVTENTGVSDSGSPPAHTQAGVVMGSPAYMAPEQARGQKVDKRADIWAFGVVVYEMLTGRKLFLRRNCERHSRSGAHDGTAFHGGAAALSCAPPPLP
jgi:serine/threonine protein kinase